MKKEAQKKLLKAVSEAADRLIEGKTCWYGKEAVEAAIMRMMTVNLKIWDSMLGGGAVMNKRDVDEYLPKPTRPGEDK